MVKPGLYKNHRGEVLKVLGIGVHMETGEEMVVYSSVDPDIAHLSVLPMNSWVSKTSDGKERFTALYC